MAKKTIGKKIDTASKAAEVAMEFVKKMVTPIKAENARLLTSKRMNSLWQVEIDVGMFLTEKVCLKINAQGEIEEYTTTLGPFEKNRG